MKIVRDSVGNTSYEKRPDESVGFRIFSGVDISLKNIRYFSQQDVKGKRAIFTGRSRYIFQTIISLKNIGTFLGNMSN